MVKRLPRYVREPIFLAILTEKTGASPLTGYAPNLGRIVVRYPTTPPIRLIFKIHRGGDGLLGVSDLPGVAWEAHEKFLKQLPRIWLDQVEKDQAVVRNSGVTKQRTLYFQLSAFYYADGTPVRAEIEALNAYERADTEGAEVAPGERL